MRGALVLAAGLAVALLGWGAAAQQASMTFFVTSAGPGKGADLGGLEGADRHCRQLAQAVGAGNRTWRAYLSATAAGGVAAVNARDRIGHGPWRNAKGAVVGVQPFGGHGLSGTGPKAGGPHYLSRFATEQTVTINTAAAGGNAGLLAMEE